MKGESNERVHDSQRTGLDVKEYEPIICSTYLSYDSLSRYKQIEKDDTANEISECEKEIYR